MNSGTTSTAVPISLLQKSGAVRKVLLPKDKIPKISGTNEVYLPHLRKVVHDQLLEDAASAGPVPKHWCCVSVNKMSPEPGEHPLRASVDALGRATGTGDLSVLHMF